MFKSESKSSKPPYRKPKQQPTFVLKGKSDISPKAGRRFEKNTNKLLIKEANHFSKQKQRHADKLLDIPQSIREYLRNSRCS